MATLRAELIGRQLEASYDGLALAAEEVVAAAVSSGELHVLDEAGCT